MFDATKPIYSRLDGTFFIIYDGQSFLLNEADPHKPDGLWDEVMAFIAENPDAVQPEPPPPEPEPMSEPVESRDYNAMMMGFFDTLSG